jgi:transposase-like protein
MAVITDSLDALIAHLRWPSEHRKRIRSTNLLERTVVEVRRRTKVIGRFPGETSALSLIWAVLMAGSKSATATAAGRSAGLDPSTRSLPRVPSATRSLVRRARANACSRIRV